MGRKSRGATTSAGRGGRGPHPGELGLEQQLASPGQVVRGSSHGQVVCWNFCTFPHLLAETDPVHLSLSSA